MKGTQDRMMKQVRMLELKTIGDWIQNYVGFIPRDDI
jgi:hypothetical protein